MTPEELKNSIETGLAGIKEKFETAKTELKGEFKAQLENEIKSLSEKFEEIKNASLSKEDANKMQEHLDKLDVKLQNVGNGGKIDKKSFAEQLEEKLASKEVHEKLVAIKDGGGNKFNFNIKAAATVVRANYAGDYLTTDYDASITKTPLNQMLFRNMMNVSTTNKDTVVWINKVGVEGGAGMTAEGAKKSQVSWSYEEENSKVKKITAFIKVSKEMLDDVSFIRSEINTDLVDEINLKFDSQLYNGDGTGNNLKGVYAYAPAFDVTGTDFETGVANANRADVLRVAIALVRAKKYRVNAIVLHPTDIALMELKKGSDGHYVMPPFTTVDGTRISSVPVVENDSVTEGTFLAGDFTKSNLKVREEVNIQVGQENDDFTKNLVTILAELRAVHYIKSEHTNAFIKGTFAGALADIAEVAA